MLLLGFLQNASLVLALCFLQRFVVERWPRNELRAQFVSGLLFGCAAVLAMSLSTRVAPGVIFDGRTVVLSMAAMFGGPVTAAAAAAMAIAYRVQLGGGGMLVGICVILSATAIGYIARQALSRRLTELKIRDLLVIGAVTHAVAILWFPALPIDFATIGFFNLVWPYFLALTAATVVTGLLLREIEKLRQVDTMMRESRHRFAELFENSAVALFEKDVSPALQHFDRLRRDGVEDLRAHLSERPEVTRHLGNSIRIVHSNAAARRLFAATSPADLRTSMHRLFGRGGDPLLIDLLCALWDGKGQFQKETAFHAFDGERRNALYSLPIPHDRHAARHVPVSMIDVTGEKSAEADVRVLQTQLEQAALRAVGAVSATIEKRDPYTSGHQADVARLAVAIAQELGWDEFKIEGLRLGATIHDIGKVSVPSEILNKPGKLSDAEFALIREHPMTGYDILASVDFPWPIRRMVLQHHERLDGSGYPHGIDRDDIIDEARIIAVADVVDAITSHRPYRPGRGVETALEEIERGRETQYDPAAVDAGLHLIRDRNFDWRGERSGTA